MRERDTRKGNHGSEGPYPIRRWVIRYLLPTVYEQRKSAVTVGFYHYDGHSWIDARSIAVARWRKYRIVIAIASGLATAAGLISLISEWVK